jgi:hypothetical protein
MKRDLYVEVSARIIAELEAGAEYAVQRCKQPALLWLQRRSVVDGTSGRLSLTALFDIQAGP